MTPDKTNPRIALENLDDRLVPSIVPTADLTTRGSSGAINGGLLAQVDARPTGTGVIHSFVRLQAHGSGSTHEQGYNTAARPLAYDENNSPQFTRALTFDQTPWVQKNGQYFREFLLDINQKSNAPLLSLDDVKVFVADRPDLSGQLDANGNLAGATKVWEFGAGNWAALNYRLNSGSGAGDMTLDVPDAAFAAAGAHLGQYVYLYSHFGGQAGQWTANSGFEEWAVSTSGNFGYSPAFPNPGSGGGSSTPPGGSTGGQQPGGGTGSLSGYVWYDENNDGKFDSWESAIGGVVVKLQGTDANGNTVVLTTTTDPNTGTYSFSGLSDGTYTIFEEEPAGYVDGINSLGSLGGTLGADANGTDFMQVDLGTGQSGTNYNFAEVYNSGTG